MDPAWRVDVGESPSDSVEREVREESGYEVHAVKLLALWDRNKHAHPPMPFHVYNKIVLQCELLGGEPLGASTETDGVGFFSKDALSKLSLGRVTPQQIVRLTELAIDNVGRQPSINSALSNREPAHTPHEQAPTADFIVIGPVDN